MTTIKFDDFLENELADNKFKEGFLTEKAILERALIKTRGSQTEAAKMLGISRTGLGGILKRVSR